MCRLPYNLVYYFKLYKLFGENIVMKNLIVSVIALVYLSGCASVVSPVRGGIVTAVTSPITATANEKGSKKGDAVCRNILGIVAYGDCSVEAAANDGSISKISTVDVKSFSILGIYSSYTTIVTGE